MNNSVSEAAAQEQGGGRRWRLALWILVAFDLAAFAALVAVFAPSLNASEQLGRNISRGVLQFTGTVFAFTGLPAFALALVRRLPRLAVVFAAAQIPLWLILARIL